MDFFRQLRQYSLLGGSSSEYRIAVEDNGEVSGFLRDRVSVGDKIEATIAAGDLVLNKDTNPVVLISQGIGSTPMVGMLAGMDPERDVVVCMLTRPSPPTRRWRKCRGSSKKLPKLRLNLLSRQRPVARGRWPHSIRCVRVPVWWRGILEECPWPD
ncbi:hypothetical protein [Corynebacterium glutamicum]|uniref:hypothetical protein n=1 Tax=Corynebacterium glutamicum TaxID=1718 RepID=UPI000AB52ED9|nr:hypothetical protein [Corynebacterium glutamicum]